MRTIHFTTEKGFTLIELLVVISIISLLASIVLASLNSARAKARDARRQADFRAITNALYLFYDSYGRMPANNQACGGAFTPGAGNCGACSVGGASSPAYDASMQELVTAGYLSVIPRDPGNAAYCWYNYGGGNSIGGIVVTNLETAPDTTTGIPPSCRPFSVANWYMNNISDKSYCICNPY